MPSKSFLTPLFLAGALALAVDAWAAEPAAPATVPALGDGPTTRSIQLEPDGRVLRPEVAAPAPAPRIVPPLSIYESCLMLRSLIEELEHADGPLTEGRVDQLDRMVRAISLYVERVDKQNSALSSYHWRRLIEQKLETMAYDEFSFELVQPLANIAALGLRANHGDIEISSVVAVDQNGMQWEFNKGMTLTGGQTRFDICFLPLPTTLAKVRVTLRPADDAKRMPRLYVDAGSSPEPEYARQSCFHMQLARDELARGALRESAGELRAAFVLLQQYQRAHRM